MTTPSGSKIIHEAVIIDSYYGWDTIEVKSLGFFEKWYDACKAADKYIHNKNNWQYPPYKWKIKQHNLILSSEE